MRTLLMELRPAALTKAKIDDLLYQLAEGVIGRARVPVTVQIEGLRTLPPEIKVALYRIAQEALNNITKHAEARHVTVSLICLPPASTPDSAVGVGAEETEGECLGTVKLCIEDDGRGFDVNRVPPDHLGLGIMHERAEAIGAKLRILSQPDRGTQVTVTCCREQRQESVNGTTAY
jgi:signal transduction histidine kinase